MQKFFRRRQTDLFTEEEVTNWAREENKGFVGFPHFPKEKCGMTKKFPVNENRGGMEGTWICPICCDEWGSLS